MRLPVWFLRQAYSLPFCLASVKNIKLKQCLVVNPSHSAITARLWETTPSDVFQTALNLMLSLLLPQRYHAVLSKPFLQTFQTHSCTCLLGFLGIYLEALGYDMEKLLSPRSMPACLKGKGCRATSSERLSFRFNLLHNRDQQLYFSLRSTCFYSPSGNELKSPNYLLSVLRKADVCELLVL